MAQDTSSSASTPVQQYPGLGLPLSHSYRKEHPFYPIGVCHSCYGIEPKIVSVRELAMMNVMEKLTDKADWHEKVFDEEIVSKWRKEALDIPDVYFWDLSMHDKGCQFPLECRLENIMDEATFQACIGELRSKAKYFGSTGIIPTLDASATIAKSDTIVPAGLHDSLRKAFDKLKADHAIRPNWHPKSNDMVQDLVHPSMYPLVYGRSRGFQAERVGVADAVNHWAGKGEIIPKSGPGSRGSRWISEEYWSDTYQWLPANMAFQKDGTVKFTSYINNLHPNQYPDIYHTIEKLVEISIPMWDQCLRIDDYSGEYSGAGRLDHRCGVPEDPSDEVAKNWIPDNMEACADLDDEDVVWDDFGGYNNQDDPEQCREDEMIYKWEQVRKPKLPSITFKEVDYTPKSGERLAERFAASGLQIIVKMASIELTPEKPEFPAGGWHVEGQLNESICATALYYLDSDNITDSSLSFRTQTPKEMEESDDFYSVDQCAFQWVEQIYGTNLGAGSGAPRLQNYGSIDTRQGRLLVFPNVFQHRVSSFKLIDPTKSGHRRFIALWLVSPTTRIISTANIPPQQMDWYAEAVLGSDISSQKQALEKLPPDLVEPLAEAGFPGVTSSSNYGLPQELRDLVRDFLNYDKSPWPMTVEEANEHRLKLMDERKGFQLNTEAEAQAAVYSFCEH